MSPRPGPAPLSNNLARELLDRAPYGIYIVDGRLRITYMNASAQAGAFRNVRPAVGRRLDEAMRVLWPQEVAQEIVTSFRRTLDSGEPFRSRDFLHPRNDVQAVEGYEWELQRIDLEADDKGVVCYYYDSTPLRTTEAALRRSEGALREALERTTAIGDATPDLIWVSDAKGNAEYVNPNWLAYTGYTLDRLHAEGWQGMNHPDDLPRLEQEWATAVARKQPLQVEFRYRRHDGAWRWCLGRTVPVLDDQGEIARWVGIITDIQDRKLLEDELRAKAHALQEADQQKNRFLATLAHELRNPMAPIRYATALLRADATPDVIARVQGILARQGAQMSRLLDDLLDMNRITRDVIELRSEPVELVELVQAAIEAATPLIVSRRHAVHSRLPEPPLWAHGDSARLLQVIGNLLGNAAKYTPPGGRIEVTLARDDSHAVLAVRDNGVGLSADMLPKLFQLFSQLHRDLEASSGGLGIGLAVSRRLVELHGGTLDASSEGVGRGAEFRVRLPLGGKSPLPPMRLASREPASGA